MPGAPGTHVTVTPLGVSTFVAGSPLKYDLSQLASLQGPPPRKTYLRQLNVNAVFAATNGAGGAQAIAFQQLFTLFQQIILQMQGHQFVNCPFQGGASIRQLNFVLFGKNPKISATVWSWGAAASTPTVGYNPEVTYCFPFYDPRGVSQEDGIIPVGILTGAYLQLTWCPANQFGANFTISTVNTQVRRVSAELIQRDELRFAPLAVMAEERQQSGLSDFITPEGVLYKDVVMCAATAAGQTAAGFTAANLTNIVFTQGGLKTHDNLDPRDLINHYNAQQGMSSEGSVADWGGGTADIIPLQYLPRSSGKTTHLLPDLNKPYLQLTGSLTTANFFMLLHYIKPTGPRTVADLAAKSNQPLPAGYASNPRQYVRAKGALKQPVAASKSQFLPQKIQAG